MALKFSTAAKNAALDAKLPSALNSGFLRIYDGSQPAGPDTAITSQVLLAELALNATAFAAASSGSKTAGAITQDSSANATGTASWFRLVTSGGTAYMDGSVTATGGGGDIELNAVAIAAGAAVQVTSLVITEGGLWQALPGTTRSSRA